MADICADITGAAESDLGVHIGTIHVDLSAVLVDHVADLADAFFKDAMCRGISDHERAEFGGMLGGFVLEVGDIDVTAIVASDGDDLKASHDGACGVGSVCGDGDQADIAVVIASAVVVGTQDQESGIFALGASVGLKGHRCKACGIGQPAIEVLGQ